MVRKSKVPFRHSQNLNTVDDELASAMDRLDAANSRVSELLQACEPEETEDAVSAEETADLGQDAVAQDPAQNPPS